MSIQWNTAFATVIGTSHTKTGQPCQDGCHCRIIQIGDGQEILLGIASDGAGSASRSEIGSALVIQMFFEKFVNLIKSENDICLINRNLILDWLEEVKEQIGIRAANESVCLREYACTILGAIVGLNNSIFFQIGDGAIVVSETPADNYGCIFWPQHGEFANQTNFIIQENLSDILDFEYSQGNVNRLAMFTDGIERLVLDFSERSVYPPALNSIFEWLKDNPQTNPNEHPSPALISYLNSSYINSRTDDDKSLVMAIRVAKEKIDESTEIC